MWLLQRITRRRSEIHHGVNFFWDTRTFHLELRTENFHPGVKWIFWTFCMIFYMFSIYKNKYILISYNWQKISGKWYYKLEKKKIALLIDFVISRCCKYGLLALLQLHRTLRGNRKIKWNTEWNIFITFYFQA